MALTTKITGQVSATRQGLAAAVMFESFSIEALLANATVQHYALPISVDPVVISLGPVTDGAILCLLSDQQLEATINGADTPVPLTTLIVGGSAITSLSVINLASVEANLKVIVA